MMPPKSPSKYKTAIQEALKQPRRKLQINMVPGPLFRQNLRTMLGKHHWRGLRGALIEDVELVCGSCGNEVEDTSKLHAHEVWSYKMFPRKNHEATLERIDFICPLCHHAEHFGLTEKLYNSGQITKKFYDAVIRHYCKINNVTKPQFKADLIRAYERHKFMSSRAWNVSYGAFSELASLVGRLRVLRGPENSKARKMLFPHLYTKKELKRL